MSSIPFTTGPVHIWVVTPSNQAALAIINATSAFGAAANQAVQLLGSSSATTAVSISNITKTAFYLGTCEKAPRKMTKRHKAPVHNDLAGPMVPFDYLDAGAECWVVGVLTKWDESTYRAIASSPFAGQFAGVQGKSDRGTLMMTEGAGYGLILRFPFYDSHPVMRANNMTAGERFYCAFLDDQETHEPGTDANKRHLAFHCVNVWDPVTNSFALFDYDVAGIPATAPV